MNTKAEHHDPISEITEGKILPRVNSGKITNNGFIVGKLYDWIWFVGAPTIGLIVAFALLYTGLADFEIKTSKFVSYSLFEVVIGTFLTGHLFLVFFRSHANTVIFKLHPARFVLVPILLLAYMNFTSNGVIIVTIIALIWDAHHSAAQTFGLGRIYDVRVGNDPKVGRKLDLMLNWIIWLGPILAGASLSSHIETFADVVMPTGMMSRDLPANIYGHRSDITKGVFLIGIPFTLYYLFAYWRLHQRGYVISFNKVILYATTAIISIFSWGFNTLGEAYFVMNFFHAWQYFAIVWAFEKKNITKIFLMSNIRHGTRISLFLFVCVGFSYGIWGTFNELSNGDFANSILLTVSILHFWYDGFIWSVQKRQV